MKRTWIFILMTVCMLGMSACGSKDAMPETSDSVSNPVQITDTSNLNGEKQECLTNLIFSISEMVR